MLTKLLKCMTGMSAAKQSTLMAYTAFTCATVNGQFFVMCIALIVFTLRQTVGFNIGTNLLWNEML